MALLNDLKKTVEARHKDLEVYVRTFNELIAKDRETLLKDAKEAMAKNSESVNLAELARDTMFVSGFHQTDIRRLQDELILAYNLYFELGGEEHFEEALEGTVQFLKNSTPQRRFLVVDGKFQEVEEGYIDRMKENYDKQGLFNLYEGPLRRLLNE